MILRFRLLFPITIYPTFLALAALLAYLLGRSGSFMGMVCYFAIIVASLALHELGHSFAARAFGKTPQIVFSTLGGTTTYHFQGLSLAKQFVILIMGPLVSYLLSLFSSLPIAFLHLENPSLIFFLNRSADLNLFWAVANLIPILPLDGGHMLKIILQALTSLAKGLKAALFMGSALALLLSAFFLLVTEYYLGAIFFYLGFSSALSWYQHRRVTQEDFDGELQLLSGQAELALKMGNITSAKQYYEKICEKVHLGEIHHLARLRLAAIDYNQGLYKEAFEQLKELGNDLDSEGTLMMHELAFEQGDLKTTAKLSAEAYRIAEGLGSNDKAHSLQAEIALRSARAYAAATDVQTSLHWLEAALCHTQLPKNYLGFKEFDKIRLDPVFVEFQKKYNARVKGDSRS